MSVSLIPAPPTANRAAAELWAVASTVPSNATSDQGALPGAFAKLFGEFDLLAAEPIQVLPTTQAILAQPALPNCTVPSVGAAVETAADLSTPQTLLIGQTDDRFQFTALPVPAQPIPAVHQAKADAGPASSPAPLPEEQANAPAHQLQPALPGIGKTVLHPAHLILTEAPLPDHPSPPGSADPAVLVPAEPASPWPDVQNLPELPLPATSPPIISGDQDESVFASGSDLDLTSRIPLPPARYTEPRPGHPEALLSNPTSTQFGSQSTGSGNNATANLPPAPRDGVEAAQQLQPSPKIKAVPMQTAARSDLPKLALQKPGTTIASHVAAYSALSKPEMVLRFGTDVASRTGMALRRADTPAATVQANGTSQSNPPAQLVVTPDTATPRGVSPMQAPPPTADIASRRTAPSSPMLLKSAGISASGADENTVPPPVANFLATSPAGLHHHDPTLPEIDPGTPAGHSSRATAAHVATQVAQAAQAAQSQASGSTDITLNPKELGHVRLSLQSIDGTMFVSIAAERPETADLMRRHIESLAQEFRGLGYQDVSFSFSGRQSGHGNNGQSANPNSGTPSNQDPRHDPAPAGDTPADRFIPRRTAAQTSGTGLDLRL